MAFQNYRPKDGLLHSQFVGLQKFAQLFSDDTFIKVIRNTLAMGVINLVATFVMAIVFAILLMKSRTWAFCFYLACRLILPPVIRLGAMSMNTVMAFLMLFVLILSFSKLEKWRKRLFFL